MKPLRALAACVGVIIVALSIILALRVHDTPRATRVLSETLGESAPSFDLKTFNGAQLKSTDLAGKVIIVNFWNSWCIPCHQEENALKEFYSAHQNDPGFVMIGIVRDDTERSAQQAGLNRKLNWTLAMDPGGKAALNFGTRGQPETYAIDPTGVIVGSQIGPVRVKDLDAMLTRARQ